jgi:autonomous glycyl radical cofactor GrcA
MTNRSVYNLLTGMLLRLMALQFNYRPSLKRYLKGTDGWINFAVGFKTEMGTVEKAIIFCDGRVSVSAHIPDDVDVVMRFVSDATLKEMLGIRPNEMLDLIMKNKMTLDGNMTYLQLFNFYVSLLLGKKHQKMLEKTYREDVQSRKREYSIDNQKLSKELEESKTYRMKGEKNDAGVTFLKDPYLSCYSLDDFPRLGRFRDVPFEVTPEFCTERPKLLIEWYRTHGFERDEKGNPENYKNLLVRISGYNAYFVTLNKEKQIELVERAEFDV